MFGSYNVALGIEKMEKRLHRRLDTIEIQLGNVLGGQTHLPDLMALEERITKLEKARGPRGKTKRA